MRSSPNRARWIWKHVVNVPFCTASLPMQHCRYIAMSNLSTGSRWVSWWTVRSERNWVSSPRTSPGEVLWFWHVQSWKNISYYEKQTNIYLGCLVFLCNQARQRKCSATWPETSWNPWWMWSTSCWAQESMSPSTMGSWTWSLTPWVCTAVHMSSSIVSERGRLHVRLRVYLCRSGAVG